MVCYQASDHSGLNPTGDAGKQYGMRALVFFLLRVKGTSYLCTPNFGQLLVEGCGINS